MNEDQTEREARNLDPISKEPGSHPVGVAVGASVGGIATGAAIGTLTAGPIGTAVGAAVGAVVGGLGGKAVAERIDPTVEAQYWRENHARQSYAKEGEDYDQYEPAYRAGWEGGSREDATTFEDAEPRLADDYQAAAGATSALGWDRARPAARAAWDRVRNDH